jgi:histidinol-phosphate phosphatase family protein
MKCAILCGGLGTRLGTHAGSIPKALVPVGGRPVIEHLIGNAREAGVTDVILLTGYLGEQIEATVGDGSQLGVRARYYHEETPLGTTGGIKAVEHEWADDFLVLYGDIMLNMDLGRMVAFHKENRALATLAVHPNDHPFDSDLVELDPEGRISAFHSKPHPEGFYLHNMVSAAAYILSPEILPVLPRGEKKDFGKHIFPNLVDTGRLFGYVTAEYLKDLGTPDRYDRVNRDWESGKIARWHRHNPRPAVFLDRDGVINREVDGVCHPDQLELIPGIASAIRRLNQSDYLSIVVTNQPILAKGHATWSDIDAVHRKLETLLGCDHAWLDSILVCPHHPERGFAGEVPELKIECECRKPRPGLVMKAAEAYNIDLAHSFFIGDTSRDFGCASAAGIRAVGVRTGYGCRDVIPPPELLFDTAIEAIDHILSLPLESNQ